jgi:cytoskeletal protein RodZ
MLEETDQKDEIIIRYLLNETSRAEREDLEDDMVLDDELAERVQTIEMLLIDRYVQQQMSPAEINRFEQGFLLFPENRVKVEDARILHESSGLLLDEEQPREEVLVRPRSGFRFPWFKSLIPTPVFAALAIAVFLLGIITVVYWANKKRQAVNETANLSNDANRAAVPPNENNNPGANNNERASVTSTPTPTAPFKVAQITLEEKNGATGQLSGQGKTVQPQLRTISQDAKSVKLILKLQFPVVAHQQLTVEIQNEKFKSIEPGIEHRTSPIRISGSNDQYMLSITVEARLLKDNETYYYAIRDPLQPGGFRITPFQISRTKSN